MCYARANKTTNFVVLQNLDVLEDFVTLHKETITKKYRVRGVHRTDAECRGFVTTDVLGKGLSRGAFVTG